MLGSCWTCAFVLMAALRRPVGLAVTTPLVRFLRCALFLHPRGWMAGPLVAHYNNATSATNRTNAFQRITCVRRTLRLPTLFGSTW